jgi:hypothetical protein
MSLPSLYALLSNLSSRAAMRTGFFGLGAQPLLVSLRESQLPMDRLLSNRSALRSCLFGPDERAIRPDVTENTSYRLHKEHRQVGGKQVVIGAKRGERWLRESQWLNKLSGKILVEQCSGSLKLGIGLDQFLLHPEKRLPCCRSLYSSGCIIL